jgi:hypothetical protein
MASTASSSKGGITIISSTTSEGLEAIYVSIVSSIGIHWKKSTISTGHRIVVIATQECGGVGVSTTEASPVTSSRARVVHGTLTRN